MHRKPYPPGTTLSGQTAIVTGSNSGLGFESARQLLQLGLSQLIVAVRSQAKGDAAADKLRKEFPSATISVWLLDMASYDSVTSFPKKCETLSRIDLVILNAGVQADQFKLLESTQHETDFQVNYLSTSLLAILLLPVLRAKKAPSSVLPPRLSIVSSDTAYWAPLKTTGRILAQFDQPELFDPMRAYQCSKLAQLFFIEKLTEHISAEDVIVNASNPGLCKGTDFSEDITSPLISQAFFWVFQNVCGRTVEVGASAMVDAVLVKGTESHGSYVSDWTIQPYDILTHLHCK